jgi:hypothetical protein
MGAIRQDSTNSVRSRKVDELFRDSFTFSTQSLTVGKNIYNLGINTLVYGSNVRNCDFSNAIISGVPISNSNALTKDYLLRGIDVARSSFFGRSFTASFTDYLGNQLSSSGNNNFNWFSEILMIGCVPVTASSIDKNYFIGYGVMGLSHSWTATSLQTDGVLDGYGGLAQRPKMTRSGNVIFIGPNNGTQWLDWPFNLNNTNQYIFAKISICDAYDINTCQTSIGTTNSQTNENDISSLQNTNFKQVGTIPGVDQNIPYSFGGVGFSRNFDQGRVMNLVNCLVQGSNINIDFYPGKLSNSIISGFRWPSVGGYTDRSNFWGDDLYSEFNFYNSSHLGYNTTPPSTSYKVPEIISMTKTTFQFYEPLTFTVSGYRNYPFCGRSPG